MDRRPRLARRGRPFHRSPRFRPVPICQFCGEDTGLIVACGVTRYFAHIRCRKIQNCVACGEAGMTVDLDKGRVVHKWCKRNALIPDSNSRIPALKMTLLAVEKDTELTRAVRQNDLETNKSLRLCTANALWYHISAQYFPAFTETADWPDVSSGLLSYEEKWQTIGSLALLGQEISPAITEVEDLLERTKGKIRDLQLSAKARNCRKQALAGLQESLSDSYLILGELELLEQASTRSAYLAYLQTKQRNPTSLSKDPETPRKEYNCQVCQGGTSEDRNPIVICSLCDEGAHMRCYSLNRVPKGDWKCDSCCYFGRAVNTELICALCEDTGGLMRATSRVGSPGPGLTCPFQWCHILCAFYCPGVRPAHESTSEKVIFCIDNLTNTTRKCEICGRRTKAYVQCQARGCGYTFHPACGLALLALGWRRGCPDQAEVLCRLHRPLPIIRNSHAIRGRKWQELLSFLDFWTDRAGEVAETVCKRPRPWESREIDALEAQIQQKLRFATQSLTNACNLTISMGQKDVIRCSLPTSYNLISPLLLATDSPTLPKRSSEECIRYYSDHLMGRMKLELSLAQIPVNLYEEVSKLEKKTGKTAKFTRFFIKI